MALFALLVHADGASVGEAGTTGFAVMLAVVLVAVWVILGVICWIFWRSKKRDDAEKRKELPWSNAPSS